jgi:hypothetical protein
MIIDPVEDTDLAFDVDRRLDVAPSFLVTGLRLCFEEQRQPDE